MSDSEQIAITADEVDEIDASDIAAVIVGRVRSKGRATVSNRPVNKVSRPGEPYNEYELTTFLRSGPDAIQGRIDKLERYIADPRKAAKKATYETKLAQLRELIEIKLPIPPPPAT